MPCSYRRKHPDRERSMDVILPDDIVATIMSFAELGAAPGEPTCPAARFACVSRRWNRIYYTTAAPLLLIRNPLRRVSEWTIEEIGSGTAARDIQTVAESWVRPPHFRGPNWWTSGYVFEGGRWTGRYRRDSARGPFPLCNNFHRPVLKITFQRQVQLRALAIEARNRPRKIRLLNAEERSSNTAGTDVVGVEVLIPPPSRYDLPEIGLSNPPIHSFRYMDTVARELPQGTPPKEEALLQNSALPVVLPEPVKCESLVMDILESHERGWVGINRLAFFE